jgi:Ni/Co efflux regulator RcnB
MKKLIVMLVIASFAAFGSFADQNKKRLDDDEKDDKKRDEEIIQNNDQEIVQNVVQENEIVEIEKEDDREENNVCQKGKQENQFERILRLPNLTLEMCRPDGCP